MKTINFFRIAVLVVFFGIANNSTAQQFRTNIVDASVKTLQIGRIGEKYSSNMIELNSADVLQIEFDQMSHEAKAYSYKILHCNADWTQDNISTNEYLSAYTTGSIVNFQLSSTTTFLYTHYSFDLPNADVNFKISGNYVVLIFEDNNSEKPVAQVCFTVLEPKVSINHTIRSNTDIELNGRYQQIDLELNTSGLSVQNSQNEIKLTVRQNNRYDNEVTNLAPTYINGSKLSYVNNKSLIFEGGNEFHSFDISSVYTASRGVDRIKYMQPHYEVFLTQDKVQSTKTYMHEFDANGKFVINYQESVDNANTEGDYMYVHFMLPLKSPFFDGQLYVGGNFNYNLLNENTRINYDFNAGMYVYKALLKQGGYNYQYRFLPKGTIKASVEKVDGSYWQTTNEYAVYVYHRPIGGRYDKLVGISYFDK